MRIAVVSLLLAAPAAWLMATPGGRVLDRQWVSEARRLAVETPPLEAAMELGTRLGSAQPILVGLFFPAAFGAHAARTTAALAFSSCGANQVAAAGLKYATDRPRPDGSADRRNSSFPSAHASGAAGLAWVVGSRHRRWAPWMAAFALWVSSSRVFLERHYVSDVLAGAVLGILLAALALQWQDRVAHWTRPR